MPRQLKLQPGDFRLGVQRVLRHRGDDPLQRLRVVRQLVRGDRHPGIEAHPQPCEASKSSADSLCRTQPANSGFQVRCGMANQCPPTRAYRNIPSGEPDEASIDEVKVLDPRHPLYGRSFRVIRRSTHRGGNFPSSYEVEYRNGSSLLIPVAATEWHDSPYNQLKLCIEALRDLVCAVDCLDSHDEHKAKRSLDNTVAGSEAAGDRRPRRRPGGGRS